MNIQHVREDHKELTKDNFLVIKQGSKINAIYFGYWNQIPAHLLEKEVTKVTFDKKNNASLEIA